MLRAKSALAKSRCAPDPDIYVGDALCLGRGLTGDGKLALPMSWQQISGRHCRIYRDSEAPLQYILADTGSTNGCFVNEQRLPKNGQVPLNDGDIIRLAGLTAEKAIEYIFTLTLEPAKAVAGKRALADATPPATNKRLCQGPGPVIRSEHSQDLDARQLILNNKEVRTKLEEVQTKCFELERTLHAERSTHRELQRALKAELADAHAEAESIPHLEQQLQLAIAEARDKAAALKQLGEDMRAVQSQLSKEQMARKHESATLVDVTAQLTGLQTKHSELEKMVEALKLELDAARRSYEVEVAGEAKKRQELEQRLAQVLDDGKQKQTKAAVDLQEAKAHSLQLSAKLQGLQREMQDEARKREAAEAELELIRMNLAEMSHRAQLAEGRHEGLKEQLCLKNANFAKMLPIWSLLGDIIKDAQDSTAAGTPQRTYAAAANSGATQRAEELPLSSQHATQDVAEAVPAKLPDATLAADMLPMPAPSGAAPAAAQQPATNPQRVRSDSHDSAAPGPAPTGAHGYSLEVVADAHDAQLASDTAQPQQEGSGDVHSGRIGNMHGEANGCAEGIAESRHCLAACTIVDQAAMSRPQEADKLCLRLPLGAACNGMGTCDDFEGME